MSGSNTLHAQHQSPQTGASFGENFPDLTESHDSLQGAVHAAGEAMQNAADTTRSAMSSAAESVGDAAGKAYEASKDGLAAVEDFVKANPIPVLVGTAAAGALLALLVANRGRSRSGARGVLRDMARYTDDAQSNLRREVRSMLNEERINRIVNAIPSQDISKAAAPWISQIIEALTATKDQAQAAVANAAGKVHDKLS